MVRLFRISGEFVGQTGGDKEGDAPRPGGRDMVRELNVFVDWTIIPDAGPSAIFAIAFPDDALARTAGFGDETSRMFGLYARAGY